MGKKIQAKIKQIQNRIKLIIKAQDINVGDLFLKGIMVLIIVALGYNIYNSYRKGQMNLQRIADEEAKLEKLLAENAELQELEEYYQSLEYKRIYARDSWNLAEPGSELYYVNRPEVIEYEYLEENDDPIPLYDNLRWWKQLILGG